MQEVPSELCIGLPARALLDAVERSPPGEWLGLLLAGFAGVCAVMSLLESQRGCAHISIYGPCARFRGHLLDEILIYLLLTSFESSFWLKNLGTL